MSLTQLNPMLPFTSPKGPCYAFCLIDYSQEHDLYFVCIQDDTGEVWTWANKELRAQKNLTLGRKLER